MKLTRIADRQRRKYNERMALRLNPSTSVKKVKKVITPKPQIRKPNTKVNKDESFTKVSNFNRKIVGKPVSQSEYTRINKQGTLVRVHNKGVRNEKD